MTPRVVPAGGATTKRVTSCGGSCGLDAVAIAAATATAIATSADAPTPALPRRRRVRHAAAARARLRAAAGDPLQLQLDVARRLPAIVGILRQAALDDVIERLAAAPLFACVEEIAGGCCGENRRDQARLALAFERLASRRHLVDQRAEREDVGARVGVLAFELLGRHVLERAEDGAFRRQLAVVERERRHRRRHGSTTRAAARDRSRAAWRPTPSASRCSASDRGGRCARGGRDRAHRRSATA